ncbi:MAG: cytochrome c biogenesis protein CcsA [Cellvibrionaceae bacterium]|nr:cytochrome c biogenesis protein CcsA [Cellvibrionaceae bacterium]
MPITFATALYSIAWVILIRTVSRRQTQISPLFTLILALGLIAHGVGLYRQMVLTDGYHFAFFKISSLFCWTANFLILLSSLRKPLHNLFLITLPISVAALLSSLYSETQPSPVYLKLDVSTASHILLSILAYSTMIVATVQTLLLAFQNYQLRHRHPTGLVRLLPPLQTMEKLLFELLWVGEILLTLVIVTGAFQIESISAQHLHHKIVFTSLAWLIYAILLWGRHYLGWRGNSAIRWSLSGFASLVLAYLGSKFVLEMILGVN